MSIAKLFKFVAITTAITLISATTMADDKAVAPITKSDVMDWMVKRISLWSPPGQTYYPDAKETADEAMARYRSIASDAISVAFDPEETPVFSGPYGRMRTAALILAVARSESGFRKDVDFGLGAHSKGDGGQSWCLMQVRLGGAVNGKTRLRLHLGKDKLAYTSNSEDLGGEDLVSDRKSCLRAGLHIMRLSFNACRSLPVEERLSTYTSGSCSNGKDASRNRVGMAIRWLKASPPPSTDSAFMAVLPFTPDSSASAKMTASN